MFILKNNKNIFIITILLIILLITFLYFKKEQNIEHLTLINVGKNKNCNKKLNKLRKEKNKTISNIREKKDNLKSQLYALEESKLENDYENMQKDLLLEEQDEKLDQLRNVLNY